MNCCTFTYLTILSNTLSLVLLLEWQELSLVIAWFLKEDSCWKIILIWRLESIEDDLPLLLLCYSAGPAPSWLNLPPVWIPRTVHHMLWSNGCCAWDILQFVKSVAAAVQGGSGLGPCCLCQNLTLFTYRLVAAAVQGGSGLGPCFCARIWPHPPSPRLLWSDAYHSTRTTLMWTPWTGAADGQQQHVVPAWLWLMHKQHHHHVHHTSESCPYWAVALMITQACAGFI